MTALASAHDLTLKRPGDAIDASERIATLHTLIRAIVSPYEHHASGRGDRVAISGPDIPVATNSVSPLALLVHEFTTNAAKYGALSAPDGRIEIQCFDDGEQFILLWKEHGGPPLDGPAGEEGFGTLLTTVTAKGQLGGSISREWTAGGLIIRLSMARARVNQS
jgi:two-component sensor histidine kinase